MNADAQANRPWLGPKRFGYGYGPRTWQGFLISGAIVAIAIVLGTTLHANHSALGALIGIPLVLIVLVIRVHQRR